MSATKESILLTALRLFSREGYEAVSVSDIAGELGITKGALYRHYRSKREIFDSIVRRMFLIDAERSQEFGVPEDTPENSPESYAQVRIGNLKAFALAQYVFWTSDPFASDFRRMITLEQFRNAETGELYRNCIVSGPVAYLQDIFTRMLSEGSITGADPKSLAVEFYAPLFLLICMSDGSGKQEKAEVLLSGIIDGFIERHGTDSSRKAGD